MNTTNNNLDPQLPPSQPIAVTRRSFIKRAAATALVVTLALGAFQSEAQATVVGGVSGDYVLVITPPSELVPVAGTTDQFTFKALEAKDGPNSSYTKNNIELWPVVTATATFDGGVTRISPPHGPSYLSGDYVGVVFSFLIEWKTVSGTVHHSSNYTVSSNGASAGGSMQAWLTDEKGHVGGQVTPAPPHDGDVVKGQNFGIISSEEPAFIVTLISEETGNMVGSTSYSATINCDILLTDPTPADDEHAALIDFTISAGAGWSSLFVPL